ncbi:SH3 domain-containing protein [Bacteroidota bacterium]
MKKIMFVLISLLFSINLIAQVGENHYVTTNTLNLRSDPSTESEIKVKLKQYDNIILLEDSINNGWSKVKVGSNEGYVYSNYVKKGRAIVSTYTYRVGAVCKDGTRSSATGRGACSHHGGVSYWLTESKSTVKIVDE